MNITDATRKNEFVTDTMGLVLWLEKRTLGQKAKFIFCELELHDKLITGTARSLKLDLITNDSTIKASKFVNTVW